jgi:hypothetical protein
MPPSPKLTLGLAVLVFVVTAVYRFNLLGGSLGGFENDEFTIVSRAAAMLRGELPSRDFLDAGVPLMLASSAATMSLTDGTLIGHAALTVTMLAFGAAMTFALAVAASGSIRIGLVVAFVQLALGPRHYNNGKIVFYAVAILAWWAYIARPTVSRVGMLAVLTAVAFLYRHDHGAFIGLGTAVVLLTLTPSAGVASTLRRALVYGGVLLVCVVPYGVYLSRNGGIAGHFRVGADFSRVDRGRTNLRWPRLSLDWNAPLVEVAAPEPRQRPLVKIQWRPPAPSDAVRAEFERRHGLQLRARSGEDGSDYAVLDESPSNLQAIAVDPLVLDTHNIDRAVWHITERPDEGWWAALRRKSSVLRARVAPGLLRADNAAPFVYYVWLAIPAVAALVLATIVWRRRDDASWRDVARYAPIVVVTGLLNVWFLRGTLPVRLADVSVLIGVLGAWLIARALAGVTWRSPRWRTSPALVVLVLVALVLAASGAVGAVPSNVWTVTDGAEPLGIVRRARAVAQQLRTPGPVLAERGAAGSVSMRAAHYLNTCLAPADRALVTGYHPEVFYFADRGFAGGNLEFRAGYWAAEQDQRRTIALLSAQSVPVVITDAREVFESRYRSEWSMVVAYLDATYRDAGDRDFGGEVLDVLVHRQAKAVGTYAPLDLPCFR